MMVSWASDELNTALVKLSAQQAAGVVRIVQAEIEGRSLSSLLDCPGQICTSTTYYGSGRRIGWHGRAEFQTALSLARRDYRSWLLENGTGDALLVLAQTAPDAARSLRQQIVGDEAALNALERVLRTGSSAEQKVAVYRMGDTGNPRFVAPLSEIFEWYDDNELRTAIVHALGAIAGWRDRDQAAAALGVLDRADVKTAAKRAMTVDTDDIDAAIERELARLAEVGEREAAGPIAGEGDAAGDG
ncbi:MAG: hypothetical protein JXR84_15305 [Anaerolineae bacterium]|nr:hypothetical protein [Anaerolineae bacterium]